MYVQSAQETGRGHKGPSVGGGGSYPGISGTESSPSLPLGVPHYATFEPGTAPPSNPFGGPGNPSNGNGSSYGNPSTYQGVSFKRSENHFISRGHKGPSVGGSGSYPGISGTESSPSLPLGVPHYATFEPGTAPPSNPFGGPGNPSNGNGSSYGNPSTYQGVSGPGNQSTYQGIYRNPPGGVGGNISPVFQDLETNPVTKGSIEIPLEGLLMVWPTLGPPWDFPSFPRKMDSLDTLKCQLDSLAQEASASPHITVLGITRVPSLGQTEGYSPPLLGPLGQLSGTVAFQPSPYGQPSESSPFNQLSSYQPSGQPSTFGQPSPYGQPSESSPFNQLSSYQPSAPFNSHERNSSFADQISERSGPFNSQPERNGYNQHPSGRNSPFNNQLSERGAPFSSQPLDRNSFSHQPSDRNPYQPSGGGGRPSQFRPNYAPKTDWAANSGKRNASGGYTKREFAAKTEFSAKSEYGKSDFSPKKEFAKSEFSRSDFSPKKEFAKSEFSSKSATGEVYYGYRAKSVLGGSGTTAVGGHAGRGFGNGHPSGHGYQGREERGPSTHEKRENGNVFQGRDERSPNSYEKRESGHERSVGSGSGYESGHNYQGREERGTNSYEKRDQSGHDFQGRVGHGNQDSEERVPS
ncbi:hornerin-like [Diaphorina citri]|uniref:Hornerin-like n=1 Tax=Diaphorina citri TaxID=121845 RepID=A0A3Q0J1A0_DIACI|nr:hornerin-like [Diaphorina citri]